MSDAAEIRAMLAETALRLFTDHVNPQQLDAAKRDGWSEPLWRELEQAELPLVGVPEAAGGAGGSLSDAAVVLRVAARHAAPVPLAETMLAGWLLAGAGLKAPRGALTIAGNPHDAVIAAREGATWRLTGSLKRVPYARAAKHLVLLSKGHVFAIEAAHFKVAPGRNLASEARDDVTLNHAVARAAAPVAIAFDALHARGALLRAVQIAGALERALELACEYARQRVQFGRPSRSFRPFSRRSRGAAAKWRQPSQRYCRRQVWSNGSPARPVMQPRSKPCSPWPAPKSARVTPHAKRWPSRIRCTAPSASPMNTRCITTRCARWPGARNLATRCTGRGNSGVRCSKRARTPAGLR
jgi:alkylation response protein AidB-like acyl-CoA dehydrogenase